MPKASPWFDVTTFGGFWTHALANARVRAHAGGSHLALTQLFPQRAVAYRKISDELTKRT